MSFCICGDFYSANVGNSTLQLCVLLFYNKHVVSNKNVNNYTFYLNTAINGSFFYEFG